MSASYDLEMVRGDTMEFAIEIGGSTSTPSAIAMTCRKTFADDSPQVFKVDMTTTQSSPGRITLVSTGLYKVRVAPGATSNLEPGNYVYDIEIRMSNSGNNDVYTPIRGKLTILPDSTR